MFRSETITVSIYCPAEEVYDFLAEPLNLPTWGRSEARIRHLSGRDWLMEVGGESAVLRYPERNGYGVLDFAVVLPTGEELTTPVRVVANNGGAEVIYTLLQRPGMTDAMFASESEWIKADFQLLKSLLEGRPRG